MPFDNPIDIKRNFQLKFRSLLDKEPILKQLLYNIFIYGTAYIVGGFFRDFLKSNTSRDVDIIVDLDDIKLLDILNDLNCNFSQNRHGGIKLQLNSIGVDLWSLENNWAFKNNLVKLNESDKLNSIAKGCFYNYDSLVINLHNYNYNIKNFNNFIASNKLDILQKSPIYKNLNPTVEANIIRAFSIKQKFNIIFSEQLIEYIAKKYSFLYMEYGDGMERIFSIKNHYPKYSDLSYNELKSGLEMVIKNRRNSTNELFL